MVVLSGILNQEEEIILEKIGLRFLSKFGNELDKIQQGNVGILKNFVEDLNKILKMTDYTSQTKKTANKIDEPYLDSLTIISLPKNLQTSALALLTIKSGSLEEITKETSRNIEEETKSLEKLVELGYVLSRKIGNEIIYYIP